jgi:hypothetical protein
VEDVWSQWPDVSCVQLEHVFRVAVADQYVDRQRDEPLYDIMRIEVAEEAILELRTSESLRPASVIEVTRRRDVKRRVAMSFR